MNSIYFKILLIITLVTLTMADKAIDDYKVKVSKMSEALNAQEKSVFEVLSQSMKEVLSADKRVNNFDKEVKQREREVNQDTEKIQKIEHELDAKRTEVDKLMSDLVQWQNNLKSNNSGSQASTSTSRDVKVKWSNMYKDAVVIDDLNSALKRGDLKKSGSPHGWSDNIYTSSNKWKGKELLNIGSANQSYGNGLKVNVPAGYDVLWLRCSNHVWGTYGVTYFENGRKNLGIYACGYRNLNEISPDGGTADCYKNHHMWTPINLPVSTSAREYTVHSGMHSNSWLSGLAWGKNLWNHARNSAVAYHWRLNGGDAVSWNTHNWNNDQLAQLLPKTNYALMVPVVDDGKDKLVYFVEHNNSWVGTMHTSVTVNDVPIERLSTAYSNPFATHFNSKMYSRYIAARVPASIIPKGARFLTVRVNMSLQNMNLHFREIGTHDLE